MLYSCTHGNSGVKGLVTERLIAGADGSPGGVLMRHGFISRRRKNDAFSRFLAVVVGNWLAPRWTGRHIDAL